MYIGIVEADRDLDLGHRLAVDEIGDAIRLPQHTVIVECGRRVRHAEIESAAFDALRFRYPPMRRHHDVARPLPASLHDVDLRRPAAVIGEHPERRPHADADRYFGADFEVSVFLGKPALRRQDARDIFIVEQHGFQRRRGPAGDDRENAVLDPERIEAERRRFPPAIARIDIDLLLAVPAGLAPEVGAVAAPIARFRPGGVAGIIRRPSLSPAADGRRNHRGRSGAGIPKPARRNPALRCGGIFRRGSRSRPAM